MEYGIFAAVSGANPICGMYSIKHKSWLFFLKSLLFASGLVLFGIQLSGKFYLSSNLKGGLVRGLHKGYQGHPGNSDLTLRYGKVFSSVEKRYHAPIFVGLGTPMYRVLAVTAPPEGGAYLLPATPVECICGSLFLRGPPQA